MSLNAKLARLATGAPAHAATLADFPEYVAELEKLRKIAENFTVVSDLLREIDRRRSAMTSILAKAIDDEARAIIEDKQAPVRTVLESDRAKIEHDVAVLRTALIMQTERVEAVKIPCIEKIVAQALPKHQQMMGDIREKMIALADALDAELAFRVGMYHEGVSDAAWSRLPANVVRAVGSRSAFSSGVNVVDRAVSEYLGRDWDYSRVTR